MQGMEEFTPNELISRTTPDGVVKSPRQSPRSPRFVIEKKTETIRQSSKRMSLPFAEMRKNERRGSANPLLDKVVTAEQNMIHGRIRRNSIIWPSKENPQQEADKQLSDALNRWKLMKLQTEPNANIEKAIMDTLLLVERYYIQGIRQFFDPEKEGELGLSYSLLSILTAMYKCPATQVILDTNTTIRSQFCSINFTVRDYRSILEEATTLSRLIKKHRKMLDQVIEYFSKKQVLQVEEFAFTPFVKGIVSNSTPQDIFKSGMLKEKDIAPFYQHLGMRKFLGLDADVAKIKMVEIIANPTVMHLAYGPVVVPMVSIYAKETLSPLKHLIETLENLEPNLEMFLNEEFELKINLAINPMGKIKERLQLMLEDLITRSIGELNGTDQTHYRALLSKVLPAAQTATRKNWIKAFEMLQAIVTKL